MKVEAQVVALEFVLMGLCVASCVTMLNSEKWSNCLWWWVMTMGSLFSFWFLGVHRLVRFTLLGLSGLALAHQYYHNITTTHVLVVASIALLTFLLCQFQYAADVVWSVKTIVIDWLVCTSLVVILTCVDALQGGQNLILAVSYFCSSNIFSVMVMKGCEALMKWRSPTGAPCAKYIHNLSIPITILPSLHAGQLLVVAWAMVMILWGKGVDPKIGQNVAGWQVMAAGGLWGSLLCYVCPIVANKNPTPYEPPIRIPRPERLQQQS